jgi:hypothetical protein
MAGADLIIEGLNVHVVLEELSPILVEKGGIGKHRINWMEVLARCLTRSTSWTVCGACTFHQILTRILLKNVTMSPTISERGSEMAWCQIASNLFFLLSQGKPY